MIRRRNLALLVAGAVIFFATAVCGFGSSAAPAPTLGAETPASAPLPTEALALPTLPVTVQPADGNQPTQEPALPAPPPAIPETRRVTLEYPPHIRQGDSDTVRLTLEVDNLGNVTPTAEIQGNTVKGQTVQIPNLYETHNVID